MKFALIAPIALWLLSGCAASNRAATFNGPMLPGEAEYVHDCSAKSGGARLCKELFEVNASYGHPPLRWPREERGGTIEPWEKTQMWLDRANLNDAIDRLDLLSIGARP